MTKMEYKEKAIELRRITGNHLADEIYENSQIAIRIFEYRPKELEGYTACTYDNFVWMLGHIYQAGKIEGIRKERARRKVRKEKS
ncbi:hypothetical protein [uncultured Tissierella sp.]|uniref:hypothetical protein n=1 Tax=uncultured Tissierella sp. TaxID=448160 RepID=UPI002804185A|nr:hypothetical protein [uncultured Tissierella sp.]MDU5081207.1 hypothetical protein [Bacillota bacterium]